jgi:hypothetical protein
MSLYEEKTQPGNRWKKWKLCHHIYCAYFYPINESVLCKSIEILTNNKFKENKISISDEIQSNTVQRCRILNS